MTAQLLIDADFHLPQADVAALLPYLDDYWRGQVRDRELPSMPFRLSSYPANAPHTRNPAFDGLEPGAALDRFGIDIAVCSMLHGVVGLHNPDMRAALLRAVNDLVARDWLDRDARLRGSIFVSGEDPEAAVAEIERLAGDDRFVQVLMLAMQDLPQGARRYWPIYAAAERHGLAVAIHAGGLYRNPPSVSGWPSYQYEDYVIQSQTFENILVSFIGEGVFVKFPDLKVILLESGFGWLPTTLWRMDKTWRGTRQEVPWIDRPPSEVMAGRVFLSLQPVDMPGPEEVERVLRHVGSSDWLLFSTDFPHRQFEGFDPMPAGLPEAALPGIRAGNALRAWPRLARDPALKAHIETLEVTP